jgi:probable rRNA maturation factor
VPTRSVSVEIVNAVRAPVTATDVRSVLRRACQLPEIAARLPEQPVSLAVRLTDDAELRRLHREYSGDDSVTDVLSFEGTDGHLGDLAISWPAVERQARSYRHPAATELALLCVHGLLHLLRWDHATPAEHREMTRVTVAALARSGIELSSRRL